MLEITKAKKTALDSWSAFIKSRPQNEPANLAFHRRNAEDAFAQIGYPLGKNEDWKYTNVSRIAQTTWNPAPPAEVPSLPDWQAFRLVIVNGYLVTRQNKTALNHQAHIYNWREACEHKLDLLEAYWNQITKWSQHPFAALNTACFQDAAILHILPNQELALPVHVLVHCYPNPGISQACFPRILIYLDKNSKASIVESYHGSGETCFSCGVVEIILERGARLDYYKIQQEDDRSAHIVQAYARLANQAELRAHIISLGGGLVRNEYDVQLTGEQAVCLLNGLYLARGRQHIDNHTEIEHVAPACTSYELYKGILSDRAHGVFHGKIYVHPGAQKTDAKQTNQALLLSDDAEVDSKPQLEIYADDVRCTHGATVGQLDEQQLFYLRTRGLAEAQARSLLVYAFAEEIIGRIEVEPVRFELEDILLAEEGLPLERQLRRIPLS